jgi:peptide/nickel transport system permease protein
MTLDYALRRIGFFLMVIWLTTTLMFVLVRLAPGDPVSDQVNRLRAQGQSLPEGPALVERYRGDFGLDEPLYEQYWDYLVQLAQGDLGYSVSSFPTKVSTLIGDALPWTLGLLLTALLVSWAAGTLLGGLLALRSLPALARGALSSVMVLSAIPYYLVALLLLYVFTYRLQWLPAGGARDPLGTSGGALAQVIDMLEHGLLPALSIVLAFVGVWMLGMRSLMVSVLESDSTQLAEAKGLAPRRVFLHYGIRVALVPQLTALATYIGPVVSGAILVEVLFSYPGLGTVLVQAVEHRDYPVIQGVALTMVAIAACALLIVDLVGPLLDPRARHGPD